MKSGRIVCFAIAALLVCLPVSVQAGRFSGAYLIRLCDMDKKGNELIKGGHTACQAYISGIMDYHLMLQSMKMAPQLDICVPEKTESNRLHAVVLAYLKKNAQHDSFVAAPGVMMALYEAFPCKRQK